MLRPLPLRRFVRAVARRGMLARDCAVLWLMAGQVTSAVLRRFQHRGRSPRGRARLGFWPSQSMTLVQSGGLPCCVRNCLGAVPEDTARVAHAVFSDGHQRCACTAQCEISAQRAEKLAGGEGRIQGNRPLVTTVSKRRWRQVERPAVLPGRRRGRAADPSHVG